MKHHGEFLTAGEAGRLYHVSQWVIVRAARQAGVQTRYCRKRWRLLYENGPLLADAVARCMALSRSGDPLTPDPVNQALNALLSAFRSA